MVKIDISDVEAMAKQAIMAINTLPKRMEVAVKAGAAFERSHKSYHDQTGNLRSHTKGFLSIDRKDEVVATLEMAEDYASYVKRRGLSAIDEASKNTELAIANAMRDIEKASQ